MAVVSVNVDVNDLTRSGLSEVRRSVNRLSREVGRVRPEINVRLDDNATRRDIRRLRQTIDSLPNNVDVNVNVDEGTSRASIRRIRREIRALPNQERVRIRVDLEQPSSASTSRFTSRLRASLMSPLRMTGQMAGGVMEDGVGQGILNGFKTAGPIGVTLLAGALVAGITVIGAALAGIIVTALGGAFVAVGVMAAAKSKEVKAAWSDTLGTVKEIFTDLGKPMIPVLTRALGLLDEMAKKAAGPLIRGMEEAVPATNQLIDALLDGFRRMGKNAFKPIMEAWKVFAPEFGAVFGNFLADLGDAFGEMATLVKEHPAEIAEAMGAILKVITLIVKAITGLGYAWVAFTEVAGEMIGLTIRNYRYLLTAVLSVFEGLLKGAEKAFGWMPGIGGKIKAASRHFSNFKDSVLGKMKSMEQAALRWNNRLDHANRKRRLRANIDDWTVKLKRARADLRKTTNQKARAKLKADISDLENKVRRARSKLDALNGKTAITNIITNSKTYRSVHDIVGKATGGNIGAAQTGGVRSNLTLVGEAGPELVNLPAGSHVRSNSDSRRFMRDQGAEAPSGTLVFKSSGRRVDDMLLEILRESIHQRGGDPIRVLGG